MEPEGPDLVWRGRMMADIESGDFALATDALLSLTNYEPERRWIEKVLLGVIDSTADLQIRQLAVICLGHVARIHRNTTSAVVVPRLEALTHEKDFASRANNALEDIEIFVNRAVRGDGLAE